MTRFIDPSLLKTFLTICETQSFSNSAEQIGRTQAAVSQQVKRLEDLLGQPVFNRDNKQITLTTAGEILYDYAVNLIALNEEALYRLQDTKISDVFHLGAPEVLTSTHLPQILSKFRENHPTVALDVTCKLSNELRQDFDNGKFDVVLFLQETSGLSDDNIIYREKLVWVHGREIDLDLDKTLPLILTPRPCVYRKAAIDSLEKQKRRWRAVMTAHTLSGRISAVKNGLGLALFPQDMLDNDLTTVADTANLPTVPDLEMAVLRKDKSDDLSKTFIRETRAYFNQKS